MSNTRHVLSALVRACPALALAALASCSQQTPSTPADQGASTEQSTEPTYGDPAEMALVSLAHKKFPADAIFSDESISSVSGEKRVCGQVLLIDRRARYIFSLSEGLNRYPSDTAWQRDCSNGRKIGAGS